MNGKIMLVDFAGDGIVAIYWVRGDRVIDRRTLQQMQLPQFTAEFYQLPERVRVWIRNAGKVGF